LGRGSLFTTFVEAVQRVKTYCYKTKNMPKISVLILLTLFLNSCSTKKTIYVTGVSPSSFVNCEGVLKQEPLQVKENKEDKWIVLHDTIEGFKYQEDYTYKIEVEITKIKNPPADGSNLHYKLVKIIYQEKNKTVAKAQNFEGVWKVSSLTGIDSLRKSPTFIIDHDAHKIAGKSGCNSYKAAFIVDGTKLTFGVPAKTKRFCSNMPIENAFFDCLEKTASFKIAADKLTLLAENGEVLLTCTLIK